MAHGRLDVRAIRTTTTLNDHLHFPHVGQAFCIERLRINKRTGKESFSRAYGLTSQTPERATPAQLLGGVRAHWAIENRSHYVRDVTFDEDRSQVRTGNGPRMMAALRNFAISLLRLLGHTNIAKASRAFAANTRATLSALAL